MEIIINGEKIEAKEGETILEAGKRNGIKIPSLCYHSDISIRASCRVCVVECNGKMVPSCSETVKEGMDIKTDSEGAEKARRINLELLFSQHQEECHDCVWNLNCKMLDLAKEYGVEINRFTDRKTSYPMYRFGPIEFDASKCIDCRNCVEVCEKQKVNFLEIKGKGHLFEVFPSKEQNKDCIYCGQCIVHCPAGAFESVGEFEKIEAPFKDKKKRVVFQIAPAVRATIGEEFDMPFGEVSTGKLVSALKKIGGNDVFDVPAGADFTTVEEGRELLERVEKDDLPMFTACCPSFVRFVEFYYPEFISRLTTVRSPHIILGGLIKTEFAKKNRINPRDIVVVSVMPCVSKKHEIKREELKLKGGLRPVDYVLTTREVGRLLKLRKIDFPEMEETEPDIPFGSPTKSGVEYGVSGGVMKSAIYNLSGKEISFEEKRKGLKEATVELNGKHLRLAVIYGLANVKEVLEELKKGIKRYDYVEVMACPGGCIGGGGQSVPIDEEIREKRREGLCRAGKGKSKKKAGENPQVKEIYNTLFKEEKKTSEICYTKYYKATKTLLEKNEQGEKNEN